MKVHMQPSELREQGRNAYPDDVNPYDWREDRCAYVNWQEGFTQSKYAADWARRRAAEIAEIVRELRDEYPAVDVTTVVFSRDFAGIGCCVIPQDRVLAIIEKLVSSAHRGEV